MASQTPFGANSPFGQMQPTDLTAMLQAAFQPAPAPEYMAMPSIQRQQADFVDLGAGGPAPGSERASGLGALGQGLQGLSQVVGSAMAANAASKANQNSIVPLEMQNKPSAASAYQAPGSVKPMDIPITRQPWDIG